MNRKTRILSILINHFYYLEIDVIDNSFEHAGHNNFDGSQESHFIINIVNNSIDKIDRLEIHRKINDLLKNEFSDGLHALEINISS